MKTELILRKILAISFLALAGALFPLFLNACLGQVSDSKVLIVVIAYALLFAFFRAEIEVSTFKKNGTGIPLQPIFRFLSVIYISVLLGYVMFRTNPNIKWWQVAMVLFVFLLRMIIDFRIVLKIPSKIGTSGQLAT